MDSVLFSTAYFPPVVYFYHALSASKVIIEQEENFIKQTYRNRCIILGANGPLNLTVPVKHDAPKINISNLQISYHSNWQLIHFRAIESAYRNSPFYEYYIDDFKEFFTSKFENLQNLNYQILTTCFCLLGIKAKVNFTTSYEKEPLISDFRYQFSPKEELTDYHFPEYHQVFSEKFPFYPNLSILDLIFNLGPEAQLYLKSVCKKNGQS